MEKPIDDEAENLIPHLHHYDEAAVGLALIEPKNVVQINKRQQFSPQAQNGRLLYPFDAMDAAGSHQLKHGKLRNCETLTTRFDDERGNNGECQRNLYGE